MEESRGIFVLPTSGRILVRPDDVEEKKGDVFIPESIGKRPLRGVVVAVGGSRDGVPVESSPGDVVYYSKSLGQEIELGGVVHLVLREVDEVHVILKPRVTGPDLVVDTIDRDDKGSDFKSDKGH